MNIFVSGHGWHREEVEEVIDALETAGHTITFDWTKLNEDGFDDDETRRQHALANFDGIWDAAVLVLLDRDGLVSALVEMGVALARLIPVVFIGDPVWGGNIYASLPTVYPAEDIAEAVAIISDLPNRFLRPE